MAFRVRGPGGLLLPEEAAPATPAAGEGRVYVATDGTLHFINDAGADTTLGAGGGGGGTASAEYDLTQDWTTTQPATPASGVTLFARHRARRLLSIVGPTGLDTALQPALFSNRVARWNAVNAAAAGTVESLAVTILNNATTAATAVTNAATNFYTGMVRARFATTATAGTGGSLRSTTAQWFLSSTANLGGFFLVIRAGINATTATHRTFFGMSSTAAALAAASDPTALLNLFGFASNSAHTNFHFIHNDGTGAATAVDLGASFPSRTAATDFYEFRLFAPSGGGQSVYWAVTRLNTGAFAQGQVTTDLPALGTLLAAHCHLSNGSTAAAASMDVQSLYVESDN